MIKPRKYCNFKSITKLPPWLNVDRSTVAWALQNGVLKEYDVSEARIIAGKGILREEARENILLYCRDASDASWNENDTVNVDPTTGLDGIANTGSLVRADMDDAIVGQSVTAAMNCYTVSVYLMLLQPLTGKVWMSTNGVDYTELTELTTQGFIRVEMTGIIENPGLWLKIENQDDFIILDCAQIEVGAFATTPIITTSAPVTRGVETITVIGYDFSSDAWNWMIADQGTINIEVEAYKYSSTQTILRITDYPSFAGDELTIQIKNGLTQTFNIGYNQVYEYSLNDIENDQVNQIYNIGTSYNDGKQIASINGFTPLVSAQAQSVDLSSTNRWYIGSHNLSGDYPFNGYIGMIAYFTETISQAELNDLTTGLSSLIDYSYNDELLDEFAIRVVEDGGTIESPSCIDLSNTELAADLIITPNAVKAGKIYALKPGDGTGDLTFDRNSAAIRRKTYGTTVANDSYESVASDVARLDRETASCPSFIFEPQRTNLLLHSADISNAAWTPENSGTGSAPVITAAYADSPIEGVDAVRVQLNRGGGSGDSAVGQLVTGTVGNNYYLGVWLKSLSGTPTVVICITAGTFYTATLTTSWVKYYVPRPSAAAANIFAYVALTSVEPTSSTSCDILVGNYNFEEGLYPTTDIITGATMVTRLSDGISKAGIDSIIGHAEGTILFDFVYNSSPVCQLLQLIDSAITVSIQILVDSDSLIFYGNNGSPQWEISTPIVSGNRYRLVCAYKLNEIAMYLNGVQIGTDSSAAIPAIEDLYLNQNFAGNHRTLQRYRLFEMWDRRLTNSQLAELSTI